MNNHWLVKNLHRLSALHRDLDSLQRKIIRHQKRARSMADKVGQLNKIDEVFEDCALTVRESDARNGPCKVSIHGVGDDRQRWADVYPNAHNGGETWGISVNGWAEDHSGHLYYGGKFLGSDFPTLEDAVITAKMWVAKAVVLEREKAI